MLSGISEEDCLFVPADLAEMLGMTMTTKCRFGLRSDCTKEDRRVVEVAIFVQIRNVFAEMSNLDVVALPSHDTKSV